LYDKPDVDAVLGQLGDSIGIIFRNAQAGSIAHPLSQEWRLVESVCSIKQMEFRHSIHIHLDIPPEILAMENFLVPMGILQIPVENALVHGLRNKEEGPKDLWISMQQQPDNRIIFTITDNGIGRRAAALIGNYRRNGVGSKNLLAIIELLNQHNTAPISFSIDDDVIEEDGKRLGTRVTISIPQIFQYDI
jgi:sensor histidine kinase YesM